MRFALNPLWLLPVALVACGNDREDNSGGGGDDGTLITSSCGAEERVEIKSQNHITGGVSYTDTPPAGGDHDPCWAPWAAHEAIVPAARWVHNLEHGGVVFLHDCADGCADEQAELEEILEFTRTHSRVLSTPYPGLGARFAAVSWGHRLVLDCIDVQAAAAFYSLRMGNGESPESTPAPPPAECQ